MEGIGGRIPRCVEAERDLIAMHHDIRDLAVVTRRVRHLAAQEDARVRVHGRLVWRDRLVQLPDHDRFRVVEQVLADAGDVLHDGDPELFELLTRAQSG